MLLFRRKEDTIFWTDVYLLMNGLFLIRRDLIGRQTLTHLASELGKFCSKPGGLAFFDTLAIFPLKETVNFENP